MPGTPQNQSAARPRIGVDGRPLFFGQQTGVSRYLRNLLDAMLCQETGLDIVLYVHAAPPNSAVPPAWRNAGIRVAASPASRQKRLWENFTLPRALRRDGADLYFSPAYVLPIRLPCPGVVTIHDISYQVHPEWFPPVRSRYVRLLSRRSARRARLILTVSEFSKTEICRHYGIPPSRVRAIHEAAERRFFEPVSEETVNEVRSTYALPEVFILYVGSLHQRRQIPEMMAALTRLHREGGFRHRLVLVGHNNYYPPLDVSDLIQSAGAKDIVQYLEFVPEKDLPPLYAAADFVVYISRYEGFGLPVLEAMAMGKPVVTAGVNALAEVADDAALLVDPTSTDEIARAFRRLAEDTGLRENLVQRGRKRAASFSWEKAATETLACFRECLAAT